MTAFELQLQINSPGKSLVHYIMHENSYPLGDCSSTSFNYLRLLTT